MNQFISPPASRRNSPPRPLVSLSNLCQGLPGHGLLEFNREIDEDVNYEVPGPSPSRRDAPVIFTSQPPPQRWENAITQRISSTSLASSYSCSSNYSSNDKIRHGAHDDADSSWYSTQSTVRDRNAAMFNNETMADVHFVVGQQPNIKRVPAHKYVLATGSSVFFRMFYGVLSENINEDITIPDVELTAFLNMLRFLYCDELELEPETVLVTLYAAKKYMVGSLVLQCVSYLEASLSAQNACMLLGQARLFEEKQLMQRCWEVIDAQAEEALKAESFCDIDKETLECILQRDTLNVRSETSVFNCALRWAEAECSRKRIAATPSNKCGVLSKALYYVRIPTMSLEEYSNVVAKSDVLSIEESHKVFLYFTLLSDKPSMPFDDRGRRGLKAQRCRRFHSSAYRSNQWRYRGRCDSIQFATNRRIFVAGYGMYGCSAGAATYKVVLELKRGSITVAEKETEFYSDGSSSIIPVHFDSPVQVEAREFYTASVKVQGDQLSFFGQEGMAEVTVDDVTFQFQCSAESTNGTGVQGGQIPEIIFYA